MAGIEQHPQVNSHHFAQSTVHEACKGNFRWQLSVMTVGTVDRHSGQICIIFEHSTIEHAACMQMPLALGRKSMQNNKNLAGRSWDRWGMWLATPVLQQGEDELQVLVAEAGVQAHELSQRQQRRRAQRSVRRAQIPAPQHSPCHAHILSSSCSKCSKSPMLSR